MTTLEIIINAAILIVMFALVIFFALCDAKYNEEHDIERLLFERW